MKRKFLWALAAVSIVSLSLIAGASAHGSDQWWTTDHAEAVILNSDWAFAQDVTDATCTGWGATLVASSGDTAGENSYKRFICKAYAQEDNSGYCLPGECSNGGQTQGICTYTIKIQSISANDFLVAGVKSRCG